MKTCFTISLALAFLAFPLLSGGVLAAESTQQYLSVLPDIPVMEGMSEDKAQSFVFDKAAGRIIETVVFGQNVSLEQTQKFYQSTLTELGWTQGKPGVFVRNGEQLLVVIEKVSTGVRVKFAVAPKRT